MTPKEISIKARFDDDYFGDRAPGDGTTDMFRQAITDVGYLVSVIDGLRRELGAVAQVGGAALGQLHARAVETRADEALVRGIVFDRTGWACSVCHGWNAASDSMCVHSHVKAAAPRELAPSESVSFDKAFANSPRRIETSSAQALVDACAPYLKEGETPAERITREIGENDALCTLLAQARQENDYSELHRVIHAAWHNAGQLLNRDDSPYHWIRDIRDEWVEICAGRRSPKTPAPRIDCPHNECKRSPACGEHCQEPL